MLQTVRLGLLVTEIQLGFRKKMMLFVISCGLLTDVINVTCCLYTLCLLKVLKKRMNYVRNGQLPTAFRAVCLCVVRIFCGVKMNPELGYCSFNNPF